MKKITLILLLFLFAQGFSQTANIVTTKTATTPTYTYYGINNVQSITYYLQVGNNSGVTAENVEVQTTLPDGVVPSAVSWSGNGTSGTGSIEDVIAVLEPGEIITYQITAPINAGFNPSHILTSANVTITVEEDEDEDEDEEIDVTYLLTNWAYIPGNDFVYTITVSNNGPDDAENVQITDLISNIPNIDINEVTWEGSNGTSGTGDLVDTVAVLEFGETITYTVVVPIPEDYDPTATIINTVEVTSDTSNDNNVCLGCTNYAAPMPLANLSILKDALTNCYLKDEWVVYEIIVTNAGPSTAYDVVIHDPIAPLYSTYGITYYNMTWEGTNGSAGTGTLNNTIDALNVGET